MAGWDDLSDVLQRFELPPNTSADQARAALKKLLVTVHPDTTKGYFATKKQEREFHEIGSAIDFLDAQIQPDASTALVRSVQENSNLVARALEEQRMAVAKIDAERKTSSFVESARVLIRGDTASLFRSQKISGGFLMAISAFLLATRGSIDEIVKALELGPRGRVAFAVVTAVLGFCGAYLTLEAYIREQRTRRAREQLLSETGFRRLLTSHEFRRQVSCPDGSNETATIALDDIVNAISSFSGIADSATCEEIAELVSDRLISRGLATKLDGTWLSPKYQLAPSVVDEIYDDATYGSFIFRERMRVEGPFQFIRTRLRKLRSRLLKLVSPTSKSSTDPF